MCPSGPWRVNNTNNPHITNWNLIRTTSLESMCVNNTNNPHIANWNLIRTTSLESMCVNNYKEPLYCKLEHD